MKSIQNKICTIVVFLLPHHDVVLHPKPSLAAGTIY